MMKILPENIIESLILQFTKYWSDPHKQIQQKVQQSVDLWRNLVNELSKESGIHLHTWFVKIAYLSQKGQLGDIDSQILHLGRKWIEKYNPNQELIGPKYIHDLFISNLHILFLQAGYNSQPDDWLEIYNRFINNYKYVEGKITEAQVKGIILNGKADENIVGVLIQGDPEYKIGLLLDKIFENWRSDIVKNVIFNPQSLPITFRAFRLEKIEDGKLRPALIVIEPDYLVDITSISECMLPGGGHESLLYLLKKFSLFKSSRQLLVGNIANFFLDSLVTEGKVEFSRLFKRTFKLNPMAFACLTDQDILQMQKDCQNHYNNLYRTLFFECSKIGIEIDKVHLEPSFVDPVHGLQGRLDLLYISEENKQNAAIIELKSSTPFMPNKYGLSANHYTQTLLYDTMIRSVYEGAVKPTNYILYSSRTEDSLRYAPPLDIKIEEAMQVRNEMICLDKWLCQLRDDTEMSSTPFGMVSKENLKNIKGFAAKDIDHFEKVLLGLDNLEKRYFIGVAGFVAREQWISKVGNQQSEQAHGQSSLWLNSTLSKLDQFEFLGYLKIEGNMSGAEDPMLFLRRTKFTSELANFRPGDVVILYPHQEGKDMGIHGQLFKCTILDITESHVAIRLRSKQINQSIFTDFKFWHIEHDSMDHSFNYMFKGVFEFATMPKSWRQLWLGITAPQEPHEIPKLNIESLTEEQNRIIGKIIGAKDYFLLWGPPGTGKTSVMLKYLVQHLIKNSSEKLLLVAYTNRAVDEICEAIELVSDYIRIGSKYSTNKNYVGKLLEGRINTLESRAELKRFLLENRIYLGTVASLCGKSEIFDLVQFDRIIIDEASQILEPQMLFLVAKAPKVLMIGDHRQLPAIVVQSEKSSQIRSKELQDIGFENLRYSLFERLYKKVTLENWHWAFDKLSFQGRMHQDIQNFPAKIFYGDNLNPLPNNSIQTVGMNWKNPEPENLLMGTLSKKRMIYINTPINADVQSLKTNEAEAKLCNDLVDYLRKLYLHNEIPFQSKKIGIITPYKAQIAAIVSELDREYLDITVDTVERYQGSSRDIIIISLCLNSAAQLRTLVSNNSEGIDRKLNVAITRARHHLIILGNKELMQVNSTYKLLIDECTEVSLG